MSRALFSEQDHRSNSNPPHKFRETIRSKITLLLPRSIRGTFILLLFIVLIPTVTVQAVQFYAMVQEQRSDAYKTNLELARSVGGTFDAYVQDILHYELTTGDTIISSQPLQTEKLNEILFAGTQQYPSIRNFDWVDTQGQIVACSGSEMIGTYIGDRPYIQQVIAGREWAISDLMLGKGSGTPTFAIARRVDDGKGTLQGIIVAAIDPQRLGEVINVERAGRDAVVIVDSQGWLVYRYPEVDLSWEQRNLIGVQPIIGQALAGQDATGITVAVKDEHKRMSAFTPIKSIGWVASASRAEDEVMGPVLDGLLHQAGAELVILIVASLVALLVSRVITEPIYRLKNQAVAVGRGELHRRAQVTGPIELKELSLSLNQMANEIQIREEALRQSENKFRELFYNVSDAIVLHEWKADGTPGRILEMNDVLCQRLGYNREELLAMSPVDYDAQEQNGKMPEIWKTLATQGRVTFEMVNVGKSGLKIPVEVNAHIFDLNGKKVVLAISRDVTERKRAEQLVRESEEKYRNLVELATDIIYTSDNEGNQTFMNDAAYRILEAKPDEVIGQPWSKWIHPDDRERTLGKIQEMLEQGTDVFDFENRYLSKSGKLINVLHNVRVLRNEHRETVGVQGIARDITEHKRGEDALKETSQTLQLLIEASPIAIIVTGLDGEVKLWNKAAEHTFGWSEEEVIGQPNPVVPEEKAKEFWAIQDQLRQGKTFTNFETYRQKKDGSLLDVSISTAVVRNSAGVVTGAIALLDDITERRLAEEENLRNNQIQSVLSAMLNISLKDIPLEEQLQIVLNQLVSVPWTQLDAKGCIFLVGDEPEMLVMKAQHRLDEQLMVLCSRVPFGQCLCGRAALSRETVFADREDDHYVSKYAGISLHGHYCVPILSGNKVLGVLNVYLKEGYIRDDKEEGFLRAVADVLAGIIERKQSEGELRKSHDDLERRVRERTTELTKVNEELRVEISERKLAEERLLRAQRLEMAGSVAAQVAHDFNNLLTPFMAYPELIKMDLPEGHPAISLCDSMLESAQHMAEINEDLLTLSRRGYFNQEPTDLNRLIEQAAEHMTVPPPTLTVKFDLASDLLLVKSSGAQVLRVISNLLSNAREAMQDIGLLTVKTENVYVSKPFGRYNRVEMGEYSRFQITDTGHGIPEEIRNKIFDPFFTTKHADRRRGSGLGLSVVQAIVEDHRGYVDLESVEGEGSTFSVYFPALRGTLEEEPKEEIRVGSEAILIVDDDELQREVVKKLLERQGYQVNTVSSGEEALVYLKEHPADLLLLDMTMPGGMDGAETYRQVLRLRPDQRAIIISGYAESDRVQETRALGAGIYLRKPISLQKLAQAVREELER